MAVAQFLSKLCLQLLKFKINKLIIVEKNEFNLFVIKKNIESLNTNNVDIEYKLYYIKEIESSNKNNLFTKSN